MREKPETNRRKVRDGYAAPTGQPERPVELNDEKRTEIRHDGKSEDALGDIPLDASEKVAEQWLNEREERIRKIEEEL
jgi:hypothetical protein